MPQFGTYEDVTPALDRPDAFFAVQQVGASSRRVLLLVPDVTPALLFDAARIHQHARSRIVCPLTHVGIHEGRYFWCVVLGPAAGTPELRPVEAPLPRAFWLQLAEGVAELHEQGILHRGLSRRAVALFPPDRPALFDFLGARRIQVDDPPDVLQNDIADMARLARACDAADVADVLEQAQPRTMAGVARLLA